MRANWGLVYKLTQECVHMHACIHTYIYRCICIHIYAYVYMHVRMYVCMSVCTYVRMYVHIYICMCMYVEYICGRHLNHDMTCTFAVLHIHCKLSCIMLHQKNQPPEIFETNTANIISSTTHHQHPYHNPTPPPSVECQQCLRR